MSFFEDASLVLIPSAQKTSKVYSVKPTDGTGDLTFTRSNDTATRVGPDGLIEKVRTSLFTYNTDFTNVAWAKQGVTAVADQIANPVNGAVDADLFYPNSSGTYRAIRRTIGASLVEVGISIYAKAGGKDILFFNDSAGTRQVAFDLSAGTFASTNATAISMDSLGGGWYRCAFSAVTELFYMCVSDGTSNSSVTANGTDGIYIWGQQTEYGVPTEFIGVTTTAAVSVGPVANVPRLDYLGSSCPRLLLEPQRTNLATYSEQFDNAGWFKANNIAVTANQAVSPDGYTNADLIYGASSGSVSSVQQNLGAASVATYTNSVFVKYSGKQWFYIFELNGNSGGNFFDIQNGVLGTQNFGSGGFITPYGNGWYKVGFTQSLTSGNVYAIYGISNADNVFTNTASGTNGALIYGAALEIGAYATSYIPTLGAAVTRGADSAYKTGIASLIGQAEGTLYAEIVRTQSTAADTFWITLSDGTINNWLFIGTEATGGRMYIRASNTVVFDQYPAISVGTHKIALAYKSGSIAVYIDGAQIFTSAATYTIGSLTGFALGQDQSALTASVDTAGAVNQALLFPTRLSNADLAALTA